MPAIIEITASNGDRAYADDHECALLAARTMADDDFDACPTQGRGRNLTFTFTVDGQHVRTVTAKALWAS